MEEKNLPLDRLVFFSDAVVAIAITLLALEIKIEHVGPDGHLHFADIWAAHKILGAFLLSFFTIANFWKVHHSFFAYIKRIDERFLWFNVGWLLFIVLLPFATSLVGNYFTDPAAMVTYCLTVLLIAVFQKAIWSYASQRGLIQHEEVDAVFNRHVQLYCNLDMLNGLLCTVIAFFSPTIAFWLLVTKLSMIVLVWIYYRRQRGYDGSGTGRPPHPRRVVTESAAQR